MQASFLPCLPHTRNVQAILAVKLSVNMKWTTSWLNSTVHGVKSKEYFLPFVYDASSMQMQPTEKTKEEILFNFHPI